MDEDARRQRMCGDKRRYLSWREARVVRRAMERKYGQRYTTYRCPYCKRIHLAHAYTGSEEDKARRAARWSDSGTVRSM